MTAEAERQITEAKRQNRGNKHAETELREQKYANRNKETKIKKQK